MMAGDAIRSYAFFNNKGGVGKTTLCAHAVPLYAEQHPDKQVLVIDMCPQANSSQFFLGGGKAGYETNQQLQAQATRRNVVGFIDWLLRGNSSFTGPSTTFRTQVAKFNAHMPRNLYIIAGDSFLESLALALNYAVLNPANTLAWTEFMTALRRLFPHEYDMSKYDEMTVFIDCNPSFSVYTQMALVSVDQLIVPMMADYSSAEGVKSIFMMLYGKYSSSALQKYATNIITFHKQTEKLQLKLPTIYEFVFNSYTSNQGVASAFRSVRAELVDFCYQQYQAFPEHFASVDPVPRTCGDWARDYLSDVKDFHTAGKVATALGIPLHQLTQKTCYEMPNGDSVTLPRDSYKQAVDDVQAFVGKLV
jgi:chromosome partitioning protein